MKREFKLVSFETPCTDGFSLGLYAIMDHFKVEFPALRDGWTICHVEHDTLDGREEWHVLFGRNAKEAKEAKEAKAVEAVHGELHIVVSNGAVFVARHDVQQEVLGSGAENVDVFKVDQSKIPAGMMVSLEPVFGITDGEPYAESRN